MATRRDAREWALQLLFQLDFVPVSDAGLDSAIAAFWDFQLRLRQEKGQDESQEAAGLPSFDQATASPAPPEQPPAPGDARLDALAPRKLRQFAESLARGTWAKRDEIDARIDAYSTGWPIYRMGSVDRNVLRLAFFEMFHSEETPPVVCINEAIDLAKYFSNSNSGSFVNGILDRAKADLKRPERTVANSFRKGRRPDAGNKRKPANPPAAPARPETWHPAP